jgi:hypothetical protein
MITVTDKSAGKLAPKATPQPLPPNTEIVDALKQLTEAITTKDSSAIEQAMLQNGESLEVIKGMLHRLFNKQDKPVDTSNKELANSLNVLASSIAANANRPDSISKSSTFTCDLHRTGNVLTKFIIKVDKH